MLATLILAASLMGQTPDNTGQLWTGNGYATATIDTTKPLKFQGGSVTCDLKWNPAMDGTGGGFESDPLDLGAGQLVRLQFYARFGGDKRTWGLAEVGQGPNLLSTIGDFTFTFDPGTGGNPVDIKWTAATLSASAPLADQVLVVLQRAGVKSFTITQ